MGLSSQFSWDPLVTWKLSNSSWFIALFYIEEMRAINFETLGFVLGFENDARASNMPILPQYRATGMFEDTLEIHGIYEIVPENRVSENR